MRYKLKPIKFKNDTMEADISFSWLIPRLQKAQKWLDKQVLTDMTPYIPMDTGKLTNDITQRNMGREGKGEVIYNTGDYGPYLYENDFVHFQTTHHPYAQNRWAEANVNANLDKWTKGVEQILNGGR